MTQEDAVGVQGHSMRPPLGSDLFTPTEEETGKISSDNGWMWS